MTPISIKEGGGFKQSLNEKGTTDVIFGNFAGFILIFLVPASVTVPSHASSGLCSAQPTLVAVCLLTNA